MDTVQTSNTFYQCISRLYYKVAYSRCAPIYGKCRLLNIDIKSVYDVTIYKGENDVICEFYLSMLR